MEQILLKYIGKYNFPIGMEPVILAFKIKHLFKEKQNLIFEGESTNGDLMYGKFATLNKEQQKIIFDRFNELN